MNNDTINSETFLKKLKRSDVGYSVFESDSINTLKLVNSNKRFELFENYKVGKLDSSKKTKIISELELLTDTKINLSDIIVINFYIDEKAVNQRPCIEFYLSDYKYKNFFKKNKNVKQFFVTDKTYHYDSKKTIRDKNKNIEDLIFKYHYQVIGKSVLGKPIYQLVLGSGKTKIFMWSQMHGNEGTTTKALFDFINFLHSDSTESRVLLSSFTFCLLPMVNPDGAEAYTRENANGIDLNRDAQNLTQPESIVLRQVFDRFQPHYAYNLHDQRTIFGVGSTGKPATLSFLAPSYNEEREINENRQKAINLIAGINDELQKYIPGQVGRFDDSFNINCIGDTFQFLGVPTILFEAGHYPNDYDREITRKYIFFSLISSFKLSERLLC